MIALELTVLGTSAARPYSGRYTSAAYIQCGGSRVLLDCGEGMQVQLDQLGLSSMKLDAVCITHLHGDHVFGLPGLLTSLALSGRTRALHLLGPPMLEAYVEANLHIAEATLTYPLSYHLPPAGAATPQFLQLRDLSIDVLPLRHRIAAWGFGVSTKDKGRKLRPGVVEQYQIPYQKIPGLREGRDFVDAQGVTHPNTLLTLEPDAPRTVAYLTDTAPLNAYPANLAPPHTIIHDATFGHADAHLAEKTGHSTVVQATAFAKTTGAKRLLLTHLSPRYADPEILLEEVRQLELDSPTSPALTVEWARQGMRYTV